METIPAILARRALETPEGTALFSEDRACSWADLNRRAVACARRFASLGARPGDRIGICLQKGLEQVVALLGALASGASAVPIHPAYGRRRLDHIAADAELRWLVVEPTRLPSLVHPPAPLVLGRGGERDGVPCLAHAGPPADPLPGALAPSLDAEALLLYVGLGSGPVRGVVLTHRHLANTGRRVAGCLETNAGDRIAGVLCLNFAHGLAHLWQSLHSAAALYLHLSVFPNDLLRFVARHRLTQLPVMPETVARMFDARLLAADRRHDLSSVRAVAVSGGALPPPMRSLLSEAFPRAAIHVVYGLTEAFPTTWLPPDQGELRPRSAGLAVPGAAVRTAGPDGRTLPPGVVGEVVVEGDGVARGYHRAEDETARRFRARRGARELWTGDLGWMDDAGFLFLAGRADDRIKVHGHRVSPTEIEEVATLHPDVREAAAFVASDGRADSCLVLAYVTTDGRPLEDGSLARLLGRHLPYFMLPGRLLQRSDLPRDGHGEPDRRRLRREVEADGSLSVTAEPARTPLSEASAR